MKATNISSGPHSVSDEKINLLIFQVVFLFAYGRGVSRWQGFPLIDHYHFLVFSEHGIDFSSCFPVLLTQGQLMVSSFSLLPLCLSRNGAILLQCKGRKVDGQLVLLLLFSLTSFPCCRSEIDIILYVTWSQFILSTEGTR